MNSRWIFQIYITCHFVNIVMQHFAISKNFVHEMARISKSQVCIQGKEDDFSIELSLWYYADGLWSWNRIQPMKGMLILYIISWWFPFINPVLYNQLVNFKWLFQTKQSSTDLSRIFPLKRTSRKCLSLRMFMEQVTTSSLTFHIGIT